MISLVYAVALAGASEVLFLQQGRVVSGRITVRRDTIIRVPAAPRQASRKPIKWKEKDAPSCISSRLAGAMISSKTTIDVIVKGGTRYRIKLEKSCASTDYYSGYYIKPGRDAMICEDRDMIYARSGGACMIGRFKTLVPAK